MKNMTPGAAEARMAREPRRCPYCGDEFTCQGLRADEDDARSVRMSVTCQQCRATFQITFRVYDADLIHGPVATEIPR